MPQEFFADYRSADDCIFERFGDGRQDFVPVSGDQDIVLNSDATPPRKINPRLDGDHHTRFQFGLRNGTQPWTLVNVEPDAVSQTMTEVLAVTGSFDHFAGSGINVRTKSTGSDRLDSPELGF